MGKAAAEGAGEEGEPGGGSDKAPFDEGLQIVLMGVIPVAGRAVFDEGIILGEGEAEGAGAGAKKSAVRKAVDARPVGKEAAIEASSIFDCRIPSFDAAFNVGNDGNNDYGESDEQ